jgi:predicted outer membrane repeat protein
MKTFLISIPLLLINTVAAFGLTLTVINHDDSGPGSLRDAIANAGPGGTIVFDLTFPDTITLTTGELLIQNDLTITGPGADLLTVARSSAGGTPPFVIFEIVDGAVTMSGLTISNGDNSIAPYGGGLHTQSFLPVTLTGCNFNNNRGVMGGGFGSEGQGGATLTFCTFTGNSASISGGAIYAASSVNVSHCTISANSATYAGGGIATVDYMQVSYSTVSDNVLPSDPDPGTADGAGIYNIGILYIDHSTIANNENGRGNGGGIRSQGPLTVSDSTLFGNTAKGDGGAIQNDAPATLTDCTIASNTASENSAYDNDFGGGGISNYTNLGGGITLKNTIIAGNHSPTHPDIATEPNVPVNISEGYNLIGDGTDSEITPTTGDQIGTSADPIDPMLDVLGNNGGATQTCALLPGSPAINVGDPDAPTRDQRNYDRTDEPDIGAFELGATIPRTLANISTRLRVETGDNVLIGGFIVTGTHDKPVLLRAIGPSLPLDGKLPNPVLELHDSTGATIATNDNWQTNTNKQEIIDTGIPPTNTLESALLMTLEPGAYTAIVRGTNIGTGIALVEVYDLDRTTDARLANISTRGLVQFGDNVMIGGFIVLGTLDQEVLIRAIGPSLPVPGSLADPLLELHNADGSTLATNDNWRDTQEAEIEATGIPPTNDAESAIITTLAPGNYTAIVRGSGYTTGVALVEAYGLD